MDKATSRVDSVLTVFFGAAVVFFYSRPLSAVTDLWWHLSNGRWIAEHLAFPRSDPFSLLPNIQSELRETLVLKGYWLAQLIYFQVYDVAGMPGLVLLKALVLAAIVFVTWRLLLAQGVRPPWALLLLIPLTLYLRAYDELRPHHLSFLFFPLLMLVTGGYRRALRENASARWHHVAGILLIMILWPNMHTGFIVGSGYLLLNMAAETISFLKGKNGLTASGFKQYAGVTLLALLVPLLNPNGPLLYRVLSQEGVAGKFADNVTEYAPVWTYFSRTGDIHLLYALLVPLGLVVLLCLPRRRSEPVEVLLVLIFAAAGFTQFRYSALFVIVATLVVGRNLLPRSVSPGDGAVAAGRFLAAISVLALLWGAFPVSAFSRGALALGPVEGAVSFVEKQKLPGPLFTPYEWGGYLQWKLFPEYKTFVDARAISYERFAEYQEAVQGRKSKVFGKYRFNTVLFYLYPPQLRQIPSLVFSLLKDDEWVLLYADDGALVFSRKGALGKYSAVDADFFMESLKARLKASLNQNPVEVGPLLDLAQICYVQNDIDGARRYFNDALLIDSDNEFATAWMKYLDSREFK